ncbi:Chimeric ERCC6-PGBD3 protein [Eumeta japonica]|uniref:Chimeric ERCC6-PGBD3 protein n=1 Tax=Eumeta variegata TaxID=151549 RepID=A0A4C1UCM6_EUMVA|nr:Chimeric ERCC6-PGBD3 protein [Eumeta japonica]
MTRDRFDFIFRHLHVNDNLDLQDKYTKVRPLVTLLNKKFLEFSPLEEHYSVDEAMFPYYGRHGCKQHIKGKPIRYGFKAWVGATRLGIASNAVGINPKQSAKRFSQSEKRNIVIEEPHMVSIYNKYMEGVDRSDENISHYRIGIRGAKEVAEQLDVEIKCPRIISKQIHRANNQPAQSAEEYFSRAIYIPLLDSIISDLQDHLSPEVLNLFQLSVFMPKSEYNNQDIETVKQLATDYTLLLDNTPVSVIVNEYRLWMVKWQRSQGIAQSISDIILNYDINFYPNIRKFLCIMATLPVSVATAERSFSTLRRIKSWLRSSMVEDRLTGLALLHVHKNVPIDPDYLGLNNSEILEEIQRDLDLPLDPNFSDIEDAAYWLSDMDEEINFEPIRPLSSRRGAAVDEDVMSDESDGEWSESNYEPLQRRAFALHCNFLQDRDPAKCWKNSVPFTSYEFDTSIADDYFDNHELLPTFAYFDRYIDDTVFDKMAQKTNNVFQKNRSSS